MTEKINKRVKFCFYALEILFLYFLQSSPYLIPEIFGAKPMLLAAVAITLALIEEEIPSVFIGLFCGLLMDISFGKYFGLFAVIMAVFCCFICALIRVNITLSSTLLIGSVCLLFIVVADWITRYCMIGYSSIFLVFFDKYLPVYLYTVLCLPILYLVNLGVYLGFRTIVQE